MNFDQLDQAQRDSAIFTELQEIRALLGQIMHGFHCHFAGIRTLTEVETLEALDRLNPMSPRLDASGQPVITVITGQPCIQVADGSFIPLQGKELVAWNKENKQS